MRTGKIGLITQSSALTVQEAVVAASHNVVAWPAAADAFDGVEEVVDWFCIGLNGKALEDRLEERG